MDPQLGPETLILRIPGFEPGTPLDSNPAEPAPSLRDSVTGETMCPIKRVQGIESSPAIQGARALEAEADPWNHEAIRERAGDGA